MGTREKISAAGSQLQGPPASVAVPWLSQGGLWPPYAASSWVFQAGPASLQEKEVGPDQAFLSLVLEPAPGWE